MAQATDRILEASLTAPKASGRKVDVVLTADCVTWATENKKLDVKVNLCDVLIARFVDTSSTPSSSDVNASLIVHYVERRVRGRHRLLSHRNIVFNGNRTVCKQWSDTINEQLLNKFPHRPKRLLVFVNPVSGKKSGPKVYHSHAEPLFSVCGLTIDLIMTKRAHHTEEVLADYDFTSVDGIVTVGGDGTYAEAVNGLARRAMAEAHEDENDPDGDVRQLALPVGIIPTGTGEGIVEAANTTKDVTTAILLIILGGTIAKDIATVHQGRKLMVYSVLLSGTGFFSEIIAKSESNRNLGRLRYGYAMLYGIVKHRSIELEVDYLPDPDSATSSKKECAASGNTEAGAGAEAAATGWLSKSGMFVRVDNFMYSIASASTTLGDGMLWLNFVRPCGRIAHGLYIKKWISGDPEAANSSVAEEVKVKAYRVRPVGEWRNNPQCRILNVDGEVVNLPEPDFSVRCHKGVSQLFAWPHDDSEPASGRGSAKEDDSQKT